MRRGPRGSRRLHHGAGLPAALPDGVSREAIVRTANWIVSMSLLMIGCSLEGSTVVGPIPGAALPTPSSIPDGNSEGLALGPAGVGRGGEILEAVELMVDLVHPNTGDVALRLCYDQNNDGRPDAKAELEFFRARRSGWSGAVANACPRSLDGAYYFRGDDSGDDPLDVFRGLLAGGSFHLAVADTLSGDAGVVREWVVQIRCDAGPRRPTPGA